MTPWYRQMRISKKTGRGRKKERPLPLVGQRPALGSRLPTRPAESEAGLDGEAHRPEHAKPHPREQSQAPAWRWRDPGQGREKGVRWGRRGPPEAQRATSTVTLRVALSAAESMSYPSPQGADQPTGHTQSTGYTPVTAKAAMPPSGEQE